MTIRRLQTLVFLCGCMWGSVALAWPVDAYADLQVGVQKFQHVDAVQWVESQNPAVASAELLPSGEVLVQGKSPGRTQLVLYADGRFETWLLRVGTAASPPKPVPFEGELAAARNACRGLKTEGLDEGIQLSVTVSDDRCRQALVALFQTDGYSGRGIEVTFEIPALQAQLGSFEAGLRAAGLSSLSVRYLGAGLVLSGATTEAGHHRALREIFERSAGKVVMDDQVELAPAPIVAPTPAVVPEDPPPEILRQPLRPTKNRRK